MYHDQALIALKMILRDEAVNFTMGLPYIRTSCSSGTAYDIAPKFISQRKHNDSGHKISCSIIYRNKKRYSMAGQKTTLDILKEYNIKPRKALGQNFLIDDNINRFIVESLELENDDLVLEIGAGLGELVDLMKDEAGLVLALEIDRGLNALLEEKFQSEKKVRVLNEDILKCDLGGLIKKCNFKQAIIVGNLPYYISSPIIFHLIKYRQIISKVIIMIQKEVAQRIVAKVGCKDYGILSCLLDYYSEKKIIKIVKSSCFFPRPKVDSAIIELSFYKNPPIKVKSEDFF